MGNKMCKKKSDTVDNAKPATPSAIDRIITRLHLKPNSWKSESQLNSKQANRCEKNVKDKQNGNKQISKSTDWTEAELEVPEIEAIHLKNPQLSFIFNDNTTPTPPPRKHKKSIREKIETVAKNSIQALQSIKSNDESKKTQIEQPLTLADETLCVKKVIDYRCPCHNRENCVHQKHDKGETQKANNKKESKRKKNLSVISLPNYSDLKLSVAHTDDDLKFVDSSNNSSNSLPGEEKHPGKLENYMTRCRSFGSLLNNKLKVPKQTADIESDDSFGGLEDWDLGILEHYNPKDASLPRTRKLRNKKDVLYDVEALVVTDIEIIDKDETPQRPLRRAESLKKKTSDTTDTDNSTHKSNEAAVTQKIENETKKIEKPIELPSPPSDEIEHSTLMKILQEYSVKDVKERNEVESSEKYVTEEPKLVSQDALVHPKNELQKVENQIKS